MFYYLYFKKIEKNREKNSEEDGLKVRERATNSDIQEK